MKSSSFLTSYINFLRPEKRRSLFGFGCANIKIENTAREERQHVIGFIRFSSTGQHLGDGQRGFSKRTQRVFQGIILLFLIAFAAVGVLLLYAGCDTGSGKLIFCGVFVFACIAIICRSAYKRKKKHRG